MGAYLCIASNGVPPSVSKRVILIVNCKNNLGISRKKLILGNFVAVHTPGSSFILRISKAPLRFSFSSTADQCSTTKLLHRNRAEGDTGVHHRELSEFSELLAAQ